MERSSHHQSENSTHSYFLSPKDAVVFRHFFICVLFVAIVHLSTINASYGNSPSNPVVCHSEECFRSEAAFKQNMNFSANPCDDFYSYVCGHWADNYPPTKPYDARNWRSILQSKVDRLILDQLETYVNRSDPKPVAQAKDMYKACMTYVVSENNESSRKVQNRYRFRVIQKYLKEFGLPTIPTLLKHGQAPVQNYKFNWIRSVAKIQRKLGFSILIGLNFAVDQMDRIRVTLGSFKYSQIDYPIILRSALRPNEQASRTQNKKSQRSKSKAKTNDDQQNVDLNSEQIENTFNSLKDYYYFEDENSKLFTLAEQFKTFRNQLPVLDEEWKQEEPMYYTVAELQNITDSHITPRKPYPVWQHYLDVLFANLPDNKPAVDDKLLISPQNRKYLCNLIHFISKQSPEHIELYIWKTVIEFFVDHRFNNLISGIRCTEYVQSMMGLAVTYAISERNFLNETKPSIEQLFNDIRSEFNQMVLETEWIDEHTKNALVEKSNAMEAHIGHPEWILKADKLEEHYRGLKVDRFSHFENWVNALQIIVTKNLQLLQVNMRNIVHIDPKNLDAHNVKALNAIDIPGGTLQYPFYHHGLEAMNYGALGYTLGHELMHGFDNLGRHYGKFGKKEQVWSNDSLQKFDERASCLVEQYDSYFVSEADRHINGSVTLNDNIADNGAVREAFRAYRSYIKRNGPEPLLPGFENFTHEQLFFMSFGNRHCETVSSDYGRDDISFIKYEFSPGKFRVQGVLSNMDEFSEAFQCPRGSKMNPEKKCRVW